MNKLYLFFIIFLSSCSTTISNTYQENYGNECISIAKTRDDLVICYVKSLKEEHIQNRLSNKK